MPLKKFYFTFGTNDCFPFKGGWIVIYAEHLKQATAIFKAYFPNDSDDTVLNCADYYTQEAFEKTIMFKNDNNCGAACHAEITTIIRYT